MLGQFDIDAVAGEIGQNKPTFRRDELSFTEGPVDLYAGTLIVSGDGGPGCVVRGQGNVVIKGSLLGNKRMPIRIEVDGDVVVMGEILHATIDAYRVYAGKNVSDAQVNARLGFEVGGDLGASTVRIGEYDLERKKIDHFKSKLEDARWQREAVERKLKMEEKRVDKLFKNTRMELASNVGRILQARRNRLVVNLEPIYASLEKRQEKDIDKALREFFAKAIVGLLTRTNRHFLMSKNRHRQEIFKGIIKDVHDLFFLTRKFDKQTQYCVALNQAVDEAVKMLNGRAAHLYVLGKCLPDLTVSLTLPEVTVSDDGKILVSGDMVRLQVKPSLEGGLDVICRSALGMEKQKTLDMDVLRHCQISMADGDVVWGAVEVGDAVVA